MTISRTIDRLIPAQPQAEGVGVVVHRTIGTAALGELDPFLLLDEFVLDKQSMPPGFPDHPHRGFETVTYMLKGIMTHRDTAGNKGTLYPGDLQWMTAGSGLIHSETPDYSIGDILGLQLWVNLPAKNKMIPPRYQDIRACNVPILDFGSGEMKLLAGLLQDQQGPVVGISVDPLFIDIHFTRDGVFTLPVETQKTVILYGLAGEGVVADKQIKARDLAILTAGDQIILTANKGARFVLIAARPIGEPIARYGPFVMSTRAEILEAIDDYKSGRFAPV